MMRTYINPTTTGQLLGNLDHAIQEIKLVREISDLNELLLQLQSARMLLQQAEFIRKRIELAESRLDSLRNEADANLFA